jgi:hypothetical protein
LRRVSSKQSCLSTYETANGDNIYSYIIIILNTCLNKKEYAENFKKLLLGTLLEAHKVKDRRIVGAMVVRG